MPSACNVRAKDRGLVFQQMSAGFISIGLNLLPQALEAGRTHGLCGPFVGGQAGRRLVTRHIALNLNACHRLPVLRGLCVPEAAAIDGFWIYTRRV